MGKEKEEEALWDDSALINAFNDAVSKYKKMHSKGRDISSPDEEKVKENANSSAHDVDDTLDSARQAEITYNGSTAAAGMGDSANMSTVTQLPCLESEAPENHTGFLNGQYVQQEPTEHLNSQSADDYNQLVNKYYELEDQRQTVLQQLNQFGYWNYNSGYGPVTSQEHQASISQPYPTTTCSVCPYGCQSWVAPCCSNGACAGKSCNANAQVSDAKKSVSLESNDIVKLAMVAAERALSSVKEETSTNCNISTNEVKDKQPETVGHLPKGTSSETDLAVVLNAWYSAGFYTGKYLSERASKS